MITVEQAISPKKRYSKLSAISAGMLMTTDDWHRLLKVAPNHSTHLIVRRLHFEKEEERCLRLKKEKGYLYFLEYIIGCSRFRQLCPLVAPINTDFAKHVISQVPAETLRPLLYKERGLYLLLRRYYCRYQLCIARQNWPVGIGDHINAFLDQLVDFTSMSPELWHLHKLYLDVRYGLSGNAPVEKQKEIFTAVLKAAGIEAPHFDIGAANNWDTEVHNILSSDAVLPLLEEIASVFHSDYEDRWTELTGSSEEERLPRAYSELSLDSSLLVLLDLRTTNALEKRGIYTFRDFWGVTKEDLSSIPNIGGGAIYDIIEALHVVKRVVETRARIEARELEEQRKLAQQV